MQALRRGITSTICLMVLAGGMPFPALQASGMKALVVLQSEGSSGSGFVVQENGSFYVVSNLHVLMGGIPTMKMLDGRRLKPVSLEVARERDLGRV